jgi:hypothetical protein
VDRVSHKGAKATKGCRHSRHRRHPQKSVAVFHTVAVSFSIVINLRTYAATLITCAYDHLGRRVSKEVFDLSQNAKLKTVSYLDTLMDRI